MEGENQGTPIENSWEQTMEGYGLWEWEGTGQGRTMGKKAGQLSLNNNERKRERKKIPLKKRSWRDRFRKSFEG